MRISFLLFCILSALSSCCLFKHAQTRNYQENAGYFVDTVHYKGNLYYAHLNVAGPAAVLWLRSSYNQISPTSDIAVANISVFQTTGQVVKEQVCTWAKLYDAYKTIDGCGATVGSVFCVVGMTEAITLGDDQFIEECQVNLEKTMDGGLGDCMAGMGDKLADAFSLSHEFAVWNVNVNMNLVNTKEAAKSAFDLWCEDIEGKSERDKSKPASSVGSVFAAPTNPSNNSTASNNLPRPIPSPLPGPGAGGINNPGRPDPNHPVSNGPGNPQPVGPVNNTVPDKPTNDQPKPDENPQKNDDNKGDSKDNGEGLRLTGDRDNDHEGDEGEHDGAEGEHEAAFIMRQFTIVATGIHAMTSLRLPSVIHPSPDRKIADSVFIKRNTARLIAKAYLIKTYGYSSIAKQQPYHQTLLNEYWMLTGTPVAGTNKQGFVIVINAGSGEIVNVSNK